MTDAKPILGLIAHDHRKDELVAWAQRRTDLLARFHVVATGTTGGRVQDAVAGLDIERVKSGPLGGDQQIGAMIAEMKLAALIFFIDPLSPHPHDVDVKALIRVATLANIPFACNEATADAVMDWLGRRLET